MLGTGASAIQFVPAIAPVVGSLTVFQRSAPWIAPKLNIEYSSTRQRVYERWPTSQAFGRGLTWRVTELFNRTFTNDNVIRKAVAATCKGQLRRQVRDPELRAKLTPTDEFGCKRVLWSNEWYPALTRPNVEVVTEPVVEVLPHGVRGRDGVEHEVDVIIYGTGFAATEFLAPMEISGVGGASLQERWKGGARAYLGLCVPDFPNLFVVYGPNTNLGGSSIIGMLEAGLGRHRLAAAAHRARGRPRDRRTTRGGAALRRGDPGPAGRQRVGQLRQLVPPQRRAHLDQLARPGPGVPGPLRQPRPHGLRDRLTQTGAGIDASTAQPPSAVAPAEKRPPASSTRWRSPRSPWPVPVMGAPGCGRGAVVDAHRERTPVAAQHHSHRGSLARSEARWSGPRAPR